MRLALVALILLCATCHADTPREAEKLADSKRLYDTRGQKHWRIGLYWVKPNEAKFKARPVGVFYTGRVVVKRWGRNFTVPIQSYRWDAARGERWMCLNEIVYANNGRLGVAYQGDSAPKGYWRASKFSEVTVSR